MNQADVEARRLQVERTLWDYPNHIRALSTLEPMPLFHVLQREFRAWLPNAVFLIDITPEGVMAVPVEALRGAGLSTAKTRTIRGLAEATLSGEVPLHDVERLGDEELVARLSTVPGIGRWTAEMFLMFQLGRLDVWPVDDLGVRKGYAAIHGLSEMPAARALQELGDPLRPYRSLAAWYCWRAVDTVVPDSSGGPPAPPQPTPRRAAPRKPAAKGS